MEDPWNRPFDPPFDPFEHTFEPPFRLARGDLKGGSKVCSKGSKGVPVDLTGRPILPVDLFKGPFEACLPGRRIWVKQGSEVVEVVEGVRFRGRAVFFRKRFSTCNFQSREARLKINHRAFS